MSNFELNAVARGEELQGKGASRRLRKQNLIPAIIYGGNEEPVAVSLKNNELVKALESEAFFSSIITITIEGGEDEQGIIKALQRHPAKGFPMHADFQRIVKGQKISMSVPVRFEGEEEAPGAKAGGILSTQVVDLDINCLPSQIPEFIAIDVSALNIGDSVHLSDIALPEGVVLADLEAGTDRTVANMTAAKEEKVEDSAAEGESEEASEESGDE
ncbi:50S ribosomal protein L25/general stress protein Ctc [Psychrobacter sp. HD31]|uniref:50S ribosomal protein L25/general stress protein Ctc n=1 Tax=Psychrobacter sp. HD31 TaxID=3112003 RepID=UPI003DA34F85